MALNKVTGNWNKRTNLKYYSIAAWRHHLIGCLLKLLELILDHQEEHDAATITKNFHPDTWATSGEEGGYWIYMGFWTSQWNNFSNKSTPLHPSQTVLLTGNQAFKHMNLRRLVSLNPLQIVKGIFVSQWRRSLANWYHIISIHQNLREKHLGKNKTFSFIIVSPEKQKKLG